MLNPCQQQAKERPVNQLRTDEQHGNWRRLAAGRRCGEGRGPVTDEHAFPLPLNPYCEASFCTAKTAMPLASAVAAAPHAMSISVIWVDQSFSVA